MVHLGDEDSSFSVAVVMEIVERERKVSSEGIFIYSSHVA